MKTTIGKFNALTKTVPVTFKLGKINHARPVNACLDDDGAYDKTATEARAAEVALGVAEKIKAGIITSRP